MKLGYWFKAKLFHSVTKKGNNYRADCQVNNVDIRRCCIYPSSHSRIPTKDNICKICFQENKEEIVFLLTKIKLNIK